MFPETAESQLEVGGERPVGVAGGSGMPGVTSWVSVNRTEVRFSESKRRACSRGLPSSVVSGIYP